MRIGFDIELSEKLFMADYSFEARKKGVKVERCTDCFAYHQDERIPEYQEYDLTKEDATPFYRKWLTDLTERINARRKVQNMTLVWNMECGSGQTLGFTTEAINFVLALEDAISLKVEVGNKETCRSELEKSGWPRVVIDTVMRLTRVETEFKGNYTLVVHRDPGRYRSFVTDRWGEETPTHVVGRSMYETSSVPSNWVSNCNSGVIQKIWVPSDFNVKTFAAAGINATLLTRLPEPLDTEFYSPNVYGNNHHQNNCCLLCILLTSFTDIVRIYMFLIVCLFIGKLKFPKNSGFVFLSISKYEARKGFDNLIKAYIEEFGSNDKVSLYIRCNADDQNVKTFNELVKNCTEEKLKGPNAEKGVPQNLPVLVRPLVPLTGMPSLYAAADCFVLPTHGEGWGLPIIEAMAMEVPVIATNWSGCTEFLHADNAFLLNAGKLVDVEGNPGHKWAEPSLEDLRGLMRRAVNEKYGEAREKAQKARSDVVKGYSHSAIVDAVVEKLREVNALPKYVEPSYFSTGGNGHRYTNTNYYSNYEKDNRPTKIKINP